jgi:hypothetical protein
MARTRAGHAICRSRVPLRFQTGGMGSDQPRQSLRLMPASLECALSCSRRLLAKGDKSRGVDRARHVLTTPGGYWRRDNSEATAFPKRSGNVPEGGRTGGFQTSAPQVRPLALPDTAAASRGHGGGTNAAPDTFGPTAHLVNLVLLVLLDCCAAAPNWIAQ